MSFKIRIDESAISKKLEMVKAMLRGNVYEGNINIKIPVEKSDARAKIEFSDLAWKKMSGLIHHYDSEVAWHGIVTRSETEDNSYYVEDIVIYPQEVSGATVTTDQEKYQDWLIGLEDDVFNNLRMQGHSHVNFSTDPSSVDEELYTKILGQLEGDMFYVFLIWNKKNESTIRIYDLKTNLRFENEDVDVFLPAEDAEVVSFLTNSEEFVQKKVQYVNPALKKKTTGATTYGTYGYDYNGGANRSKSKKKEKGRDDSDDYNGHIDGYWGTGGWYY